MFAGVYLGVAVAAYQEAVRVVKERVPPGFTQSLAHHPDVRRIVAKMGVNLECGRLLLHRAAWLMDTQGYSPEANAAMLRAKYFVGELVTEVTRSALTMGGAHALFKGSSLERFFRDGATGPIMPPAGEFCLYVLGMMELGLRPDDLLPPLKPQAMH
jgi:alkylation response protein AidB-like acyl-CoA dehydrogenase